MPYQTNADLPVAVKSALPTGRLRTAWRKAFNAAFAQYKDETRAFKTAWAEVGKIATKGPDGKWKVKPQYAKPAKKGLFGQLAALLKELGEDEDPEAEGDGEDDELSDAGNAPEPVALRSVEVTPGIEVAITKTIEEKRVVMGWSTVCTVGGVEVEDLQHHVISPDVMEEAYDDYALASRRGNDMHQGDPTSVLLHGFPFTKGNQAVLGIDLGMEGYFGIWKVLDDETWKLVKAGKRPMFSIGGMALLEDVPDAA